MINSKFLIPVLFALTLLVGCQDDKNEFISVEDYTASEYQIISSQLELPEKLFHYSSPKAEFVSEENHKATLGRVLFYDKNLSSDGTISCASCHHQELAFSDNKKFSQGVNGNITKRNSIALGALRNFGAHYDDSDGDREVPGLFWDERVGTIKDQLKETINNPNEMGMELNDIVSMVKTKDYYDILFNKAFGENEINEDQILESLESFINSITSTSSKFETAVLQDLNYITGDSIVGQVSHQKGFDLFNRHCNSCHSSNVSLSPEILELEKINLANNGLKITNNDLGVYNHTLDPKDIGKFKVPGLRNIELTAPYMHDGRFETLEQVVDFYNSGIEINDNLHPALKQGNSVKRMNLSESEKASLVSFLKSLTDTQLATEDKWSDPFL